MVINNYESFVKIPPRDVWNPIDEALYKPTDLFMVKDDVAERLKLQAIKYSLEYHYVNNRFYHNLCEHRDFTPKDVKTLDDLDKIPLVPDTIFKQYPKPEQFISWLRGISTKEVKYPNIESVSYLEIIDQLKKYDLEIIFSSGSSGKSSFVPRDPITLSKQKYFYLHFYKLLGRDPEEREVIQFILTPDYRKIHPNWIIAFSVWSAFDMYNDKLFYMMDVNSNSDIALTVMGQDVGGVKQKLRQLRENVKEKDILEQIGILENLNNEDVKGIIFGGVPFTLNDFLLKIEKEDKRLTLGKKWYIQLGGGGWMMPQEELYAKVEQVLGIPKENCRDIYGATERVVQFPACEGRYYHIPPTLCHPFILDDDLEAKSFGEYGRLAFIDILSDTYPAFIITGDRVKLLEHCPSCNRSGPVISPPVSRMPGAEDRGCASMVKKLLTEETEKP